MSNLISMAEIRSTWTRKYGTARATAMLSGAVEAAYDSRYGLHGRRFARDGDPSEQDPQDPSNQPDDNDDSGMAAIKTFLKNRLDPDSWQQLCQMMEALSGGGQEGPSGNHYDPPDSVPEEQATDEPPAFSGRPRPGGQMDGKRFGQDARGSSYLDDFSANAHVDVNDYYGRR